MRDTVDFDVHFMVNLRVCLHDFVQICIDTEQLCNL